MNIILYTIGLSFLSRDGCRSPGRSLDRSPGGTRQQEILSTEGRRILSLLDNRPLNDSDIVKEFNGRPYFYDRRGDFNISHSGSMAAVSLVKPGHDAGYVRTGCDVQLVSTRSNTAKMAEQFFSPAEYRYIFSQNEPASIETKFFMIWVLKETYIKLKGLSVFDMAAVPSFVREDGDGGIFCFDAKSAAPISFYLYELSGHGERYMLAAAVEGGVVKRPLIRWFSQSVLPVRSIVEINAAASPAETVSPNI